MRFVFQSYHLIPSCSIISTPTTCFANLWNMNLWSPTVHVFKCAEFPLWKHRKTTHTCRQVSHLRDPLVEIQDEGAYLLIPLRRPWWFVSMKKNNQKLNGFLKGKTKVRTYCGIAGCGWCCCSRPKCQSNKCQNFKKYMNWHGSTAWLAWLACFNEGDKGRRPSMDHLIWNDLEFHCIEASPIQSICHHFLKVFLSNLQNQFGSYSKYILFLVLEVVKLRIQIRFNQNA